uniref:Type 2 DNA topoisomerase 6 subunit B n=1 Tax=Lygus hesperus TaxID=30085 RepID=A0A0A9X1B9_LYGHE
MSCNKDAVYSDLHAQRVEGYLRKGLGYVADPAGAVCDDVKTSAEDQGAVRGTAATAVDRGDDEERSRCNSDVRYGSVCTIKNGWREEPAKITTDGGVCCTKVGAAAVKEVKGRKKTVRRKYLCMQQPSPVNIHRGSP